MNTDFDYAREMDTSIRKDPTVSSEDIIFDLSSPNSVVDSFQEYLTPVLVPVDRASLLKASPQATGKYHRNNVDKKEGHCDALLPPPLSWDVQDSPGLHSS